MAMSFPPKMLYCTAVICLLFYKEAVNSTLCHFFHYYNVTLFFILSESGFLLRYSSVCHRERKNKCIVVLGVGKGLHFHNSGSPYRRILVLVISLCVLPGGGGGGGGADSCPH